MKVFSMIVGGFSMLFAHGSHAQTSTEVCVQFNEKEICANTDQTPGKFNYYNLLFYSIHQKGSHRKRSDLTPKEIGSGEELCRSLVLALPYDPNLNELFSGRPHFKPLEVGGFDRYNNDVPDEVKIIKAGRYWYLNEYTNCGHGMQGICFKKKWQLESLSCGHLILEKYPFQRPLKKDLFKE